MLEFQYFIRCILLCSLFVINCRGALSRGSCDAPGRNVTSCDEVCRADGSCQTWITDNVCDCSGTFVESSNQVEAFDSDGNFLGLVGRKKRQTDSFECPEPDISCKNDCRFRRSWQQVFLII